MLTGSRLHPGGIDLSELMASIAGAEKAIAYHCLSFALAHNNGNKAMGRKISSLDSNRLIHPEFGSQRSTACDGPASQ